MTRTERSNYLRSILAANYGWDRPINERLKSKLTQIQHSIICPFVLCGYECWPAAKDNERHLTVAQFAQKVKRGFIHFWPKNHYLFSNVRLFAINRYFPKRL